MSALILGGGTISYVRGHLALCAPAFGATARQVANLVTSQGGEAELLLTRMADPASFIDTNEALSDALRARLKYARITSVFLNAALCDFTGQIGDIPSGAYAPRLQSREGSQVMHLAPADKVIATIKVQRPDIYLVGSKTTTGSEESEQVEKAMRQIEETKADLVLANDTKTRISLLVNPRGVVRRGSRTELLIALAEQLILADRSY